MGFLKRLLSVRRKKKREVGQKSIAKDNVINSNKSLSIHQEEDTVDGDVHVTRLLRSSSAHFSVISQGTECRSMPPIPHPINNVLRAPSIKSNVTQTDSYQVTIHHRIIHSVTELPNVNHDSEYSPPSSLRRQSLPTLTPGDKSRLARLRQDASVLSLLEIYDEKGNPSSQAFSNTPQKEERKDTPLHILMGGNSEPNFRLVKTGAEESDISWAERQIRATHCNSSESPSSLGISTELFKTSLSSEDLQLQQDESEIPISSRDFDIGIDSLAVEKGTLEDTSLQPATAVLTSPARRASQFFQFLQESTKLQEEPPLNTFDRPVPSSTTNSISDPASRSVEPVSPQSHGPHIIWRQSLPKSSTVISTTLQKNVRTQNDVLVVRKGPKLNRAQLSPLRKRQSRSSAVSSTSSQQQLQAIKPGESSSTSLLPGASLDQLNNTDWGGPSAITLTARSVSVASSVHPEIETQSSDVIPDPYTPIPSRRAAGRENDPPNAPARPIRGQSRARIIKQGSRSPRRKRRSDRQITVSTKSQSESTSDNISHNTRRLPLGLTSSETTTPATPQKNPVYAGLQKPSPASSAELSPQGRRMMTEARERARKAIQDRTAYF